MSRPIKQLVISDELGTPDNVLHCYIRCLTHKYFHMNKLLVLLIMLQASGAVLQAQSKKQQIEILSYQLDSANRIYSQSQSQIATMAIVLDRKKNENDLLISNIEELTQLNGLLKDSLQTSRFRMNSFGHQVDSLKDYIFEMSKPSISDEELKKYIEIEEWCSNINATPVDQFFALGNDRESGMTVRFHTGTKKVALITLGVSACGDCWARYRFYFDNNNNLIREEYSDGCAVEGDPSAISFFISTLIHNEYWANYPTRINRCYNATGPMMPEYLYSELKDAKSGYVAKSWRKIEATSVNEFFVFECIDM